MTTPLYSNPPLADFVLSEASGQRSRDNVVVTMAGDPILSGTVLTKLPTGEYVPFPGVEVGATADAVLYSHLPEATGDFPAVAFTADCEVRRGALIGLTGDAEADLATKGIKVRGTAGLDGVSTPAL